MTLEKIIKDLQVSTLDHERLMQSTKELAKLGYKHNSEQFPSLENTRNFPSSVTDSPSNLAEALLWKLGKWKAYKNFAKNYNDQNAEPTKTDVVFYAFAKHLKSPNINPIYDQHAIRALWAIDVSLSVEERDKCKALLFKKSGQWKETGSGSVAIECYDLYVRQINKIKAADHKTTLKVIDQLLMPLGQAIKSKTNNYNDFINICSK